MFNVSLSADKTAGGLEFCGEVEGANHKHGGGAEKENEQENELVLASLRAAAGLHLQQCLAHLDAANNSVVGALIDLMLKLRWVHWWVGGWMVGWVGR